MHRSALSTPTRSGMTATTALGTSGSRAPCKFRVRFNSYCAVSLTLDRAELLLLTDYMQPAKQLAELLRQGFYRARIGRAGAVILERAHFEAVCAGNAAPAGPRVRPPKLRMSA